MSDQALLREVVMAPRRAYLPFPGLRVVERPGWCQVAMVDRTNVAVFNQVIRRASIARWLRLV